MVSNAPFQRLRRGARIQACYTVKSVPPLSTLDSAFQLQEYISLLIRLDPHDVDRIVAVPDKSTAEDGTEVVVDEACWIYEQLRRLAQDLSHPLITVLQQECNRATCPEMKAGEWLYLCVAHGNDGAMEQCCAIDYIIHTLDSATALLNSPRVFPSRLQIPATSFRHFSSLARRLSRVFAHAYYHHRDAFEQAEAESSLYARFLALSARFALVPQEFLVIPPRANEEMPEHAPRGMGSIGMGAGQMQLLASGLSDSAPQNQQQELGQQHEEPHPPAEPTLPPQLGHDDRELDPLSIPPTGSGSGFAGEGGASPNRRAGRTRTDTMVLSDVNAVAEQLAQVGYGPGNTSGQQTETTSQPKPLLSDPMASTYAQVVVTEPEEEREVPAAPQAEPEPEATGELDEQDVSELAVSGESTLHDDVGNDPFGDDQASEEDDEEEQQPEPESQVEDEKKEPEQEKGTRPETETQLTAPPTTAEDAVDASITKALEADNDEEDEEEEEDADDVETETEAEPKSKPKPKDMKEVRDVDASTEGGATVLSAVEESLPAGSVVKPVSTSTEAPEVATHEKEEAEEDEDEEKTDGKDDKDNVDARKPTGLDAAVKATEDKEEKAL